jgi:hypothetical protein
MLLSEHGFAVILEELYWAKRGGMTVASVPISLTPRSGRAAINHVFVSADDALAILEVCAQGGRCFVQTSRGGAHLAAEETCTHDARLRVFPQPV